MPKLDLIPSGSVGTPEFQDVINALVLQALATTTQKTIKRVAVPATAASSGAAVSKALVGTYKKTVKLEFQDADGNVHTWINSPGGLITLTGVEGVSAAPVGAPGIDDTTPAVVDGVATVLVTYDTNGTAPGGVPTAGTKVYAPHDTLGFTTVCAAILGITVDVTGADFTDTCVA